MSKKVILLAILTLPIILVIIIATKTKIISNVVTPEATIEKTDGPEEKQSENQKDKDISENPSDFYRLSTIDVPFFETDMKEVTFSLNLENIKVEPFITNIGVNGCRLVDDSGNVYGASTYSNELELEKAIVTGESKTIKFTRIGLMPNFNKENEVSCKGNEEGSLMNMKKCVFNSEGQCECTNIGKLELQSCEFAISSNGSQAGNGWGMHQQTVNFK